MIDVDSTSPQALDIQAAEDVRRNRLICGAVGYTAIPLIM